LTRPKRVVSAIVPWKSGDLATSINFVLYRAMGGRILVDPGLTAR